MDHCCCLLVEYPKFYTLYPFATTTADDTKIIDVTDDGTVRVQDGKMSIPKGDAVISIAGSPADMDELNSVEEDDDDGSLRALLERMLESPKTIVVDILAAAERVDRGDFSGGNPKVKSVIVAGLMRLVHDGKISAVFEVFEQIDGKVADKVKLLGNDVFIKRFDTIAPSGAVKNADGIYQLEAPLMTDTWAIKLEQGSKKR